jgi:hypothetical protein
MYNANMTNTSFKKKSDYFNFPDDNIVNFPFICIPSAPTYGVHIPELVVHAW